MATVNFLYRSTKDKAFLNLRFLYRYGNIDFVLGAKTQLEVDKIYWSKLHKKKSKDINVLNKQIEINTELNRIENYILIAFNAVSPDVLNKQWLKTQMDLYYDPPIAENESYIPTNLIDYIEFYIDYRKHELKETSIKKIRVIKHKLQRMQDYRKKTILIKDINDSFKNEFVGYLKSQSYSKNTRHREFVFIKTFCNHARFLGLETHSQLDSLSLDRDNDIPKVYLTFEDLAKIEKIDEKKINESLRNAKDWLIISAYTAQRVSDFMRFTDECIRVEEGNHFLEFTQKKTGKLTTVPVHPKVLEILNKRNGKFPNPISHQKYNDYIKIVCELAKLDQLTKGCKLIEIEPKSGVYRKKAGFYKKWELVTSHIGRRSFATNFYGKVPTSHLINITNHSSESQFLAYVGKSSTDLAKETFKYFNI